MDMGGMRWKSLYVSTSSTSSANQNEKYHTSLPIRKQKVDQENNRLLWKYLSALLGKQLAALLWKLISLLYWIWRPLGAVGTQME